MAGSMLRVLVTRDEAPDGPLCAALRRLGLHVICEPLVYTVQLGDAREEAESLRPKDWLVLTSPRAIRFVHKPDSLPGPQVAVVGEQSAAIARGRGFRVALTSPTGQASGLWRRLAKLPPGTRVCFPKSRQAPAPDASDIDLTVVDIYESRSRIVRRSIPQECDLLTFTSPSAAASWARQFGRIGIPAVSIGPTTSRAIKEHGGAVAGEPEQPSLEALARTALEAQQALLTESNATKSARHRAP